ncbi:MAG: ABC transporter ATP-binding protein [Candidatus Omnitrophica bacterium]|nr:ABC transporter ATP-binding protein [Candidatus Omnitrophota bacterium]
MVRTERLAKQYGKLIALEEFSLEVPRGEILALVGPNGAGKTTALKLMVGLLTPTTGRVLIGGYDVHRQPLEVKRLLSFVPDQPFLYESLTVAELLGFVGSMYQIQRSSGERRAAELLGLFGLEEVVSERVGRLSYGMKSRLALIVSLLHEPEVLFLDEPFFGLDPQTLRLVKRLLLERARQGVAVVLSTHQLSIVEDVAHRIAIISHGRLLALGRLEDLTRQHGVDRLEELFFQLTTP